MADDAKRPHAPDTHRTPSCSIISSSRLRLNYEDASAEMSKFLNILGYGPELRQKRRECCIKNEDFFLERWVVDNLLGMIIVGSKAEGISRCFESDWDVLFVFKLVECIEARYDINSIPENTPVFRMDTQICYPGHCILLLERGFPLLLFFALCDNGHGKICLGSDALLNILKIFSLRYPCQQYFRERAGPSLPYIAGPGKFDLVFALRCHCPSLLHRWEARSRHWPPPDIVSKVVSMGAFLTPVGSKGSENKNIEWRICFNTSETELMINLNDTQMKLYVLLKMIAKDILKPRNKEITSYMLKNIVLWLAENNPQSMFHERSLFFWMRESLLDLRTALSKKHLQYYMIPERNLMAATELTDAQGRLWIATLTDMMNEGPYVIRRLPKIRQAIISHPEPLLWYNTKRFELEIIVLELVKRIPLIPLIGETYSSHHLDYDRILCRVSEIMADVSENMCCEESTDIQYLVLFYQELHRLLM